MKNILKLLMAVLFLGFLVGCGGGGGGSSEPNNPPAGGNGYDQSKEDYSGATYNNSIGMPFIRVPAGVFQMGADPVYDALSPIGTISDETPHQVNITKAYYLGTYEVGAEEWENITGEDLFPSISAKRIPASKITFSEIESFIDKLNKKENRTSADRPKYRLPTEAEWEYAARLDENGNATTTAWSFGNDPDELIKYATYNITTGHITKSGGTKNSTGLGFYDIYGHLYEYVSDWYDANYGLTAEQLAGITVDPKGPNSGNHMARGGGYDVEASTPAAGNNGWAHIRSATRFSVKNANIKDPKIGFRLLLEIPDSAQ
ncbi:MAG: formylglycine-generating enzyme family protein [Campylobacteraceae bacterium]|jgi:formylglycine-generating enzyme required for sulfatase activity|nr:formylglycine-generating enzyme family protein [Campylobacteraceae bacterium]